MVEHTDKAELIAQLDKARGQLARSVEGLRRGADVGSHLKHSFVEHKAAWLGSAGIAGWVLSRLPARKKQVIVRKNGGSGEKFKEAAEAGVALAILKALFTLFRPMIMSFAGKKIADFASKNEQRWK